MCFYVRVCSLLFLGKCLLPRCSFGFQSTALPTELLSRHGYERPCVFNICQSFDAARQRRKPYSVRYDQRNALMLNEFL